MRNFLLFVLLLNTGCEASEEVKGCLGGWFEFTCRGNMKHIKVLTPTNNKGIKPNNLKENIWEPRDTQHFLYHNTTGKYLRVAVKQLKTNDFGKYKCKFSGQKKREEQDFELENDSDHCFKDDEQIKCTGAETTINCNQKNINFICKESNKTCVIIQRGPSPVYTITNVSLQDEGVYWCGHESPDDYRVLLRKIDIQVVNVTTGQLTSGQDFTHKFNYTKIYPTVTFFCKGQDPLKCKELVNTSTSNNGSFSIKSVTKNSTIIITIRKITLEDSGSYWCWAKRYHGNKKLFFHKLELTVVTSASSTVSSIVSTTQKMPTALPPTHPVSAMSSTAPDTKNTVAPVSFTVTPTLSAHHQDNHWNTLAVIAVVCVAILLLAFIVFCLYKRFSHFNNTSPANKEEHCYEEIQEHPLMPGLGTALKTIYATASFPTEDSPGHVYSTVNHPTSNTDSTRNNHSSDAKFKENVLYSTAKTP